MHNTIDILPEKEWLTTAETAKFLRKSERAVQQLAQDRKLKWKPGVRNSRLYDAKDVKRFRDEAPRPSPDSVRRKIDRQTESPKAEALPRSDAKLSQALDTVSLMGTFAINHRAEMQMLVEQLSKNLETMMTGIATMFLTSQKQESDANRERLKAEREDARERWEIERKEAKERWEIERQDKLSRRKPATLTAPLRAIGNSQ